VPSVVKKNQSANSHELNEFTRKSYSRYFFDDWNQRSVLIGTQMTQIRQIYTDFFYPRSSVKSASSAFWFRFLGTQMTQIRQIYTDFFYPWSSVKSASSAFWFRFVGTQMTQIRQICTDFFYPRSSVKSASSAFWFNWNTGDTDQADLHWFFYPWLSVKSASSAFWFRFVGTQMTQIKQIYTDIFSLRPLCFLRALCG
jgi:hypothetical protein